MDITKSQQEANEVVRRVAQDQTMQDNVNRFKALVQIRANNGARRASDIVEEVLFMRKENGQIPHRWDVKKNMSFIKANNLDIYAFLITLIGCLAYGVWHVVYYFIVWFVSTGDNKLKTL
jgi:hypothetical protein